MKKKWSLGPNAQGTSYSGGRQREAGMGAWVGKVKRSGSPVRSGAVVGGRPGWARGGRERDLRQRREDGSGLQNREAPGSELSFRRPADWTGRP